MTWEKNTLVLDNGVVSRKIVFDPKTQAIQTTDLTIKGDKFNFTKPPGDEFGFEVDDKSFTGASGWKMVSVEPASDAHKGEGATVTLKHASSDNAALELKIIYLLYPDSPTIRKRLIIKNTSNAEVKLESVDVEKIAVDPHDISDTLYTNYARRGYVGSYIGTAFDSMVVLHHSAARNGIVLGNESPGFLKRTAAFVDDFQLTVGLTHKDQQIPFRKWLKPGETFESPWSFICLYHNTDRPTDALSGPAADYVRKYMGLHLMQIKYRPQFLYDTFVPFGDKLSDKMALELGKAAAECGVKDYLLDAGWHKNEGSAAKEAWSRTCGDWLTETRKFPRGMGPFFEDLEKMGMNNGIWMSIATVGDPSNVFKDHPEWLVIGKDGKPTNLHIVRDRMYTACMTTGWYDHIKESMLKYVKECNIKYLMLDLAFVNGAYRHDGAFGCCATNHPHKDQQESTWMMYQRAWQVLDDMHQAYPGLYIDFSYEAMGAFQLIDLDVLKHADGNWYMNCDDPAPLGSLRVRNLSWWTTGVIPPECVSIGNLRMDGPYLDVMMCSQTGSFPVMLGDPRLLKPEQRARYKQWGEWLTAEQAKHNYLLYRQDLAGFGEPQEGMWDGFQRINTDTQEGGIVGVFRQGGIESQRTVCVERLKPDAKYQITRAPEGKAITTMTGKELAEKGFPVTLNEKYDAAVFDVSESK